MNEPELIRQVQNGNSNAFRYLVSRYQKLVVHITGRVIQNQEDLEDVCQEVFIKIFRNITRFKGDAKLSTWIASIAYNTSLDYLKKYRKKELDFTDRMRHADGEDKDGFQGPERKDLHRYIREQIELLPLHYRSVVTLYHLEEFNYKEIEEITGMPEGTVKSYLHRARQLLKEKLKFVVTDKVLTEGVIQ
ncbi:MAG: sigma-70 family RNA polymerase sigma factor [Prolixibacteraceae bacterium]|jgi:RNA polymerase sigma-70 factor (ECF subfamily)|nr:sigma-70 family RNA polymerase sigma factor [Prolixibacteraceae bacterium]